MYSRVNMPGALSIGDLGSANEVRIGLGGALSVINPGSGAGQVSVVGPLSATSVNPGTGSMTCGALSAGSVTVRSGGVLRASVGSASAPALCVGTDSSVGLFSSSATLSVASAGAEWLRVGSTVETFTLLRVTGTNSELQRSDQFEHNYRFRRGQLRSKPADLRRAVVWADHRFGRHQLRGCADLRPAELRLDRLHGRHHSAPVLSSGLPERQPERWKQRQHGNCLGHCRDVRGRGDKLDLYARQQPHHLSQGWEVPDTLPSGV